MTEGSADYRRVPSKPNDRSGSRSMGHRVRLSASDWLQEGAIPKQDKESLSLASETNLEH